MMFILVASYQMRNTPQNWPSNHDYHCAHFQTSVNTNTEMYLLRTSGTSFAKNVIPLASICVAILCVVRKGYVHFFAHQTMKSMIRLGLETGNGYFIGFFNVFFFPYLAFVLPSLNYAFITQGFNHLAEELAYNDTTGPSPKQLFKQCSLWDCATFSLFPVMN